MNVAALQKHLRDLAEFLESSDAGKTVVKGVKAISDGLSPFAAETVEAFAEFLKQAEEYRRTGVLPLGKAKKAAATAKAVVAPPALDEVKGKVAALYGQAPTATDPQISALLDPLEKQFKLPDLQAIAEVVGVGGTASKLRTKGKVIEEIRRAIVERRGMAQRSEQ